jgi:hypothetical protein
VGRPTRQRSHVHGAAGAALGQPREGAHRGRGGGAQSIGDDHDGVARPDEPGVRRCRIRHRDQQAYSGTTPTRTTLTVLSQQEASTVASAR